MHRVSGAEATITYWLDKLGFGNDEDGIDFDREALHGQPASPEFAAVMLLNQIGIRD